MSANATSCAPLLAREHTRSPPGLGPPRRPERDAFSRLLAEREAGPPAEALTPPVHATAPQHAFQPSAPNVPSAPSVPSVHELAAQLVTHIAWNLDPRRAAARIELGRGRYAGAVVTVLATGGRVHIEVSGHSADHDELRERIEQRLTERREA